MASSTIRNFKDVVKTRVSWAATIGTGLTVQQHSTDSLKTYLDAGYTMYAIQALEAHLSYNYALFTPIISYIIGNTPTVYVKALNPTSGAISDTIIVDIVFVK
jgi:hypothetical protein